MHIPPSLSYPPFFGTSGEVTPCGPQCSVPRVISVWTQFSASFLRPLFYSILPQVCSDQGHPSISLQPFFGFRCPILISPLGLTSQSGLSPSPLSLDSKCRRQHGEEDSFLLVFHFPASLDLAPCSVTDPPPSPPNASSTCSFPASPTDSLCVIATLRPPTESVFLAVWGPGRF